MEKTDSEYFSEEELIKILKENPKLSLQSFKTLNEEISPLTYEIISRQATINVGKSALLF